MKYFIVLLTFLLSTLAFAQEATLQIQHYQQSEMGTVNVPVEISGFDGIAAISIYIAYDTLVLSCVDFSDPAVSGFIVNSFVDLLTGIPQIGISWSSMSGVDIPDGNLLVLELEYHGGTSPLSFIEEKCEVIDDELSIVPLTFFNGSISGVNTYSVEFDVVGTNGTVSASVAGVSIDSGELVEEGENILFEAFPDDDFQVMKWQVNGAIVTDNGGGPLTSDTYLFEDLDQDIDVTVAFELIEQPETFTLTLVADPPEGGTLTGGGEYLEGQQVEIVAVASQGWEFVEWTDQEQHTLSDQAAFTYTMPASDVTLAVRFEADPVYSENPEHNAISIYPNPVRSTLYISSPNEKLLSLRVYDLQGEKVYASYKESYQYTIRTNDFSPGAYLLYLQTTIATTVHKVIFVPE